MAVAGLLCGPVFADAPNKAGDAADKVYFVRMRQRVDRDVKEQYLAGGIQFRLPGVEPGILKSGPGWPLLPLGAYILFNAFPGQPGITPIALHFTWVAHGRTLAANGQAQKAELEKAEEKAAGGRGWGSREGIGLCE